MSRSRIGRVRFRLAAEQHRPPRGARRQNLFDAFVRGRRLVPVDDDLASAKALAVGSGLVKLPTLASWEDLVTLREQFLAQLPRGIAIAAGRGLLLAGEQLSREGALHGRPRHRRSARCRGCDNVRLIECVRSLLCGYCVGEKTQVERFESLCDRVRPVEAHRRAIIEMLIEDERKNGIRFQSFLRVRYLAVALVRIPDIGPLRTWAALEQLRAGLKTTLSSAQAHVARWGVFRLSRILLSRGVLPSRPRKSIGSMDEQLKAPLAYFDDDCVAKRSLLVLLIEYYQRSRITITAVQVVWGFAYYLTRNPAPSIATWQSLQHEAHRVMRAGGRWARRIQTALLRIGDALEHRGELPARERYDDLPNILRRMDGDDDAAELSRRFLVDMHRHQRRPSTLRSMAGALSDFWEWARGQGMAHPAQVSRDSVDRFLRERMRGPRTGSRRSRWCIHMRTYFRWLRRERLVLHSPIPDPLPAVPVIVRVATRRAIEDVVRALVDGRLASEDALLVYLILFHCVRNFEAARVRGLGYHHGVFRVALPSVPDDGCPRPTGRTNPTLALPTDRHPWLRAIVDGALEARAAKLKHPNTPYLFVSEFWRRGERPLDPHVIWDRVTKATERAVGVRLTPVVLRDTGAILAVDASNHTVCLFLGWSPSRAIDFGFARREVVATSVDEENSTWQQKTKHAPGGKARPAQKRA